MADDWGMFQNLNSIKCVTVCVSVSILNLCVCVFKKRSSSLTDADDFDPDAGFQKEGGDEWEGEDEGLDTEVSLLTPFFCMY